VGPQRCLPPIRCHGAPGSVVQPGQNCCDSMGNVSLVCPMGATGAGTPCRCPTESMCVTGGERPAAGRLCCAGLIDVNGVCCAAAGSTPVQSSTPCCFGSALDASAGRCVACVPYLGVPNAATGESCCPGLSLVEGVCQIPCMEMGSCFVAACDGVFVPGTFDSCSGTATCVPDPSVVLCRIGDERLRPEVCGRASNRPCSRDSDCAPPRLCHRTRLECVDWEDTGPNITSHTCWLGTDRGRIICRDGRRLNCGLDSGSSRPPCPICP
jgi:hypothetical protein